MIMAFSVMSSAQVFTDLGNGAAAQAGSGNATVASESSVWSYAVNPAGFSKATGISIGATHYSPYQEAFVKVDRLSALFATESWGVVNLHADLSAVKYGGNELTSEKMFGVSHAFYLQKDLRSALSFGYSINLLSVGYGVNSAGLSGDGSDGVGLSSATAVGVDLGFQAALRNRSWMGVFIQNINQPTIGSGAIDYYATRKVVVGAGYQPYYGLTTSLAVEKVLGGDFQYNAGVDYSVLKWLDIRAGLNTYPSQISLGAGIHLGPVGIDYALVNHPILPSTHIISFDFSMPKK